MHAVNSGLQKAHTYISLCFLQTLIEIGVQNIKSLKFE